MRETKKDIYARFGIAYDRKANKIYSPCHACIENEHVLFIEHSTEYQAEKDPLFPVIVDLINSQDAAENAA